MHPSHPVPSPAAPRRSLPTIAVLAVVAAACLLLTWLVDGWYARLLRERERAAVRAAAAETGRAIDRELARRVSLLAGLRAFAESHARDRAALETDFPVFAAGLLSGLDGVRALQFVQDSRIVATWPLAGNEAALGYDLSVHPDPRVSADVRRAVEQGWLVITGPVQLVQGGTGLLVRLATARGVYPELVNIILDLPTLLRDAGLDPDAAAAHYTLRTTDGQYIAGARAPLDDPVVSELRLEDGQWQLLSVPPEGWGAASVRERRLLRVSALLIASLLLGVAALASGRQRRLEQAVHERTLALSDANRDLAREVDERRVAERALRDRAEELRVALRAGQMGIWAWDIATGRIQWGDGVAELYGVRGDAPSSYEGYLELLQPEDRAALHDVVQATLTTGAPYRVQHRVVPPEGPPRWLFGTAELELDAAGKPARLLGIVMDITARVALEEQVRHAQKMDAVGTLAGGIAHDFNNLLTAILGFARLAQESVHGAARTGDAESMRGTSDDLDELIRAAERAAGLTAQLLAFSRQQVAQPAVLDVNAAVGELESMLSRLLDERIRLRVVSSPVPLHVRADAGQLSQVLLNLVVNARDAQPEGGEIVVETALVPHEASDGGDWVEVRVTDRGPGIPAPLRERIFDPFFTTKAPGKGTGLGLSMVWGIVTQAGGEVLVDSQEGRGTSMCVRLPAVAAVPTAPVAPAPGAPAGAGDETILVVEDEPGVRRLVSEIFERAGYTVCLAADGEEALAVLERPDAEPIALVVSDVVMPRMGGVALRDLVRERYPELPVLLMSGYPAPQAGPLAPDTPLLVKPFRPQELLAAARRLLDGAPRRAPLPQATATS